MVKINSKMVMIQTGKEIDRIIKTNIISISELDIWRYMEGFEIMHNRGKNQDLWRLGGFGFLAVTAEDFSEGSYIF